MSGWQDRRQRAERIGLWRWELIREVADDGLTAKQRGRLVRELAGMDHPGPFGGTVTVSRESIDRWIRAWKTGGLAGLTPAGRTAHARTPAEVLEFAAALKRERPERTAAQVRRIIVQTMGDAPSESTLLRHFRQVGLPAVHAPLFGRFQADFPNEIWVGDALHGPRVDGRKTYLFAFIDDYSRYVVAARWATSEDVCRLEIALRPALLAHGLPNAVYVDNGAALKDAGFARCCARLGIRLIHATPRRPQGKGKIERFFRTVTGQFLVEISPGDVGQGSPVGSLEELNALFNAWVQESYHRQVNDTTGQTPADRWARGWAHLEPRRADPARITEAFLWQATRTVSVTGTISLLKAT